MFPPSYKQKNLKLQKEKQNKKIKEGGISIKQYDQTNNHYSCFKLCFSGFKKTEKQTKTTTITRKSTMIISKE